MEAESDSQVEVQRTPVTQPAAVAEQVLYRRVNMVMDRVRINLLTFNHLTSHRRSIIHRLIRVHHNSNNRFVAQFKT